jgi:tripartite-type tricarboxylate transporter receptor subunit TctC
MRWIVVALAFLLSSAAWSGDYPNRPIRLIVPYPAGGSTDMLARAIQEPLSGLVGQSIVIENKGGAGGIVGTEAAARSAPDGYTLVFGNLGPNAINASTHKRLAYDPIKDFAPVSIVAQMPMYLAVNPKLPARGVSELIALARSKPGEIPFASVGVGSASHVTGELFNSMAGIKLLHVPYRGGAPAVNDVLAGHVPVMFVTSLEGANHIKEGTMIALGGTPKARSAVLPDVPPKSSPSSTARSGVRLQASQCTTS